MDNASVADEWGVEYWPKECSSIIDAGFNGGGLRSLAWLRKYLGYMRGFYHKASLVKTSDEVLRFASGGPTRTGFASEYRHTHLGEWDL